jgi:hypothetical protein
MGQRYVWVKGTFVFNVVYDAVVLLVVVVVVVVSSS